MQQKSVLTVLEQHTGWLMSLPGVVGTGQGERDGVACIRVFVADERTKLMKEIPSELEGYPVEVQVTGEFRALGAD